MYFVYIIYSTKLDRYYTGITHDVEQRVARHNSDYYENKWTSRGKPWALYMQIECEDRKAAEKIEGHIKRMKSKQYIQNLRQYPEIIDRLKLKYPADSDG
jgi:putative endonuclease